MPVRVRVPIRLRVDPEVLSRRQDTLLEAFHAAVQRALAKSHREVIAPRGGYLGVTIRPPEFAWGGPLAEQVEADTREDLEALLSQLVLEGAERAGLFDLARAAEELGWPLEEPPQEMYDRTRATPFGVLYRLPFYNGGGNTDYVENEDEGGTGRAGVSHGIPGYDWQVRTWPLPVTDRQMLYNEFNYASTLFPVSPSATHTGLIWSNGTHLVVDFTPRNGDSYTYFTVPINSLQQYEFIGPDADPPFRLTPGLPTPTEVRLTFLGPYQPDAAQQAVEEAFLGNFRERIRRVFPRPATLLDDEYARLVDNLVANQLESQANSLREGAHNRPFHLGLLRFRTSTIAFPLDDPSYAIPGEVCLLPVTVPVVYGTGEGEGAGGSGQGAGGAGSQTGAGGQGGQGGGGQDGQGSGGQGQGGFIFDPTATPGEGGFFFPASGAGGEEQDCSSLLGEPPLDQLPEADASRLRQLMGEIAYKLQIVPCDHAARFCVNAAGAIAARAAGIATAAASENRAGLLRPIGTGAPNLGSVHFDPLPSPLMQLMRHLAGVVPLISGLSRAIMDIYGRPEIRRMIMGTWSNDRAGWSLHFLLELSPQLKQSVGLLFGYTCQLLLLQLLQASRQAIDERLGNIVNYARNFEQFLLPQLTRLEELIELRSRLQNMSMLVQAQQATHTIAALPTGASLVLPGVVSADPWLEAARSLTDALVEASRSRSATAGNRGQIVVEGNQVRIWDSQGHLWTMEALERSIVMRRGTLEEIEPLVKQFSEIPEVMARFRNPSIGVRAELQRLLGEMSASNTEKTTQARNDWQYAFRASRINENLPSATIPGTSFVLQGIHLMAHQQLGEFFGGDPYYPEGINSLFNAELGFEALKDFFEYGGIILLSVICPPLGVAFGMATAAYHYEEAADRQELYQALIDPDLVMNRAELEAEMFAARLGLALAFIPEAGSILGRGASIGVRLGARGSARLVARTARGAIRRGLVRSAGRALARHLTTAMIRQIEQGLVRAFLSEIMIDRFMDRIIREVMEPVMAHVEREAAVTGSVGGSAGVEEMLRRLQAEERAHSESGAEAWPSDSPSEE